MIIEFVGLMGAGKTTLHRETVQRLNDQGRTIWTPRMLGDLCGKGRFARARRLWFRLQASWWSRALVVLAVLHLFGSARPLRDKLRGLRWFLTSLGNRWKARQSLSANEVVLIDEGLAQRVFNIFIHGCGDIDLDGVRKYARAQPLPDVLIYLTVHSDVATLRTASRSKKIPRRFRSLNRAELGVMFANAGQALDTLVEEIRKSAPSRVHVIVIRTDDLPAARRELEAQVDALLATWHTPSAQPVLRADPMPPLLAPVATSIRRRE